MNVTIGLASQYSTHDTIAHSYRICYGQKGSRLSVPAGAAAAGQIRTKHFQNNYPTEFANARAVTRWGPLLQQLVVVLIGPTTTISSTILTSYGGNWSHSTSFGSGLSHSTIECSD